LEATTIVLGYDGAVAFWVRQRLTDPVIEDWGPCTAIGIAQDGDLIAGIVFNNLRWPNIEASIASTTPRWCSRRNLAAIFAYPFRQLDCHRLGATTGVKNQPARAFLCRLGFREEGICRQALPPSAANPAGDAVIYGMTPGECWWLSPSRNRQGNNDNVERWRGKRGATGLG
jgi:RimJ/RimL family protein N-acetyltransferase